MISSLKIDRQGSGLVSTIRIRAGGRILELKIDNASLVFDLIRESRSHDYGPVGYDAGSRTILTSTRSFPLTELHLSQLMAVITDPVQYDRLMLGEAQRPATSKAQIVGDPRRPNPYF